MPTGQDLIDKFEYLVDDDNTDPTRVLELINAAYDEIAAMRIWGFLMDTSQVSIVPGTVEYTAPTDAIYVVAVRLYSPSSDSYEEFTLIPFKDRRDYYGRDGYVYYDKMNEKIGFTKTPDSSYSGKKLEFDFTVMPDDLDAGDTPVFNKAFHNILAYYAAKHFWFNDQGTEAETWISKNNAEYNRLLSGLISWDTLNNNISLDNVMPESDWSNLNGLDRNEPQG